MKKLYEEPTLEFIKLLFDSDLLTGSITDVEENVNGGDGQGVGGDDGGDPLA